MPHQPVIPHSPQYSAEQTHRITTEGGNRRNSPFRASRVLFQPLSCSQEGRRTTASNQPQSPKQLCKQRTFQNGGHSYTERSPEERGLAGQNRFERCVLLNTHSSQPQKFLRFMFKGKAYQFNCLPFSLSSVPWVFTKTLKPALAILRERGVWLIAYKTICYFWRSPKT